LQNRFSELYKEYSLSELLEILADSEDFQPEAVQAAKAELELRNADPELLAEARLHVNNKRAIRIEKIKKQEALTNSMKEHGKGILHSLNPANNDSVGLRIRITAFLLILLLCHYFNRDYNAMINVSYLYDNDLTGAIFLIAPYFFAPVGIFYFWRKQKFGWSIIAIWLAYYAASSSIFLYADFYFRSQYPEFAPMPDMVSNTLKTAIPAGLLAYINTSGIIAAFRISEKRQIASIVTTVLLTAFYWYLLIMGYS
jgi:hypothetical protein